MLLIRIAKLTWTRLTTTGPRPTPRAYHTAVQMDRYMIMHGGHSITDSSFTSNGTRQNSQVPIHPSFSLIQPLALFSSSDCQ
jgi:hypothetical protein